MPSVNKRGDTFRIMVSLGYDLKGRQIRKTTTFKPPEGVTPGKAELMNCSICCSNLAEQEKLIG